MFSDGSQDELSAVMNTPETLRLNVAPMIAVQQPVPEPPSVWLVGLGMMGAAMLVVQRRRSGRAEVKISRN